MKMKKFAFILILTMCLTGLLLVGGCSNDDKPGDTPNPPTVNPNGEVQKLVNLIGKVDSDVVTLLGEGTATKGEGTIVREYEMSVYGQKTTTAVSTEGDKVAMISSYFDENKFDDVAAKLTEEFGKPASDKTIDEEGNSGHEKTWKTEAGIIISLKDAYASLSLEIFTGE